MAMTTQAGVATGDGAASRVRDPSLEPPGADRRGRVPEFALALGVVAVFALASVLWHMSSTAKDPALALLRDVRRGEVIEAGDVGVVYIASDDPVAHLTDGDRQRVVGRVALTDLAKNTLLTPTHVAGQPVVGEGEGMVGLALEPGQYPVAGLVPGDRVNVVAGPASAGAGPDGDAPALLVEAATVFSIEELESGDRRFVALKMSEADANDVAAAAERGPIRLVLVAR